MAVDIESVSKCLKTLYVHVSPTKIFLGNGGTSTCIWEKLSACISLKSCPVHIFLIEEL